MSDSFQKRRIYCNRCKVITNHELKGQYHTEAETDMGEDEAPLWEKDENFLYACAGCETATLVIDYWNSYSQDEAATVIYPKRRHSDREVKLFFTLPKTLTQTYRETIRAHNDGSLLLCTIGLRTLLEGVCDDKALPGSNLEEKIDNLKSLLPNGNITEYLHSFRFSGNEAAHQLAALTQSEADDAITVMEDLLNYLYDLDYKASRMKHAQKKSTKVGP